jgi:hypothetical protein
MDTNPPVGEFTYEEFHEMVKAYHDRYCQNELSAPVNYDNLKFFGNRKVVYLVFCVRLEALHE